MTANVPGYFGSDHNDRRYKLAPDTVKTGSDWRGGAYADEKYFSLVKEEEPGKGTILVYNNELGKDRLVGWQEAGSQTVTPYTASNLRDLTDEIGASGYLALANTNTTDGAQNYEIEALQDPRNAKLVNQTGHLQVQRDIEQGVNGSEKGTTAEAVTVSEDITESNAETAAAGDLEVQGMLKQALDGKIDDRVGTNKSFPNLKYPLTLQADKQDIIKFTVMEYKPSKFKQGGRGASLGGFEEVGRGGSGGFKDRKPIGSVTFPIPGGIREDNSVDWGEDKMNPIEAAFAKIGLDFLTSNDAVGTVGAVGEQVKARQREIGGGLAMAITKEAVGTSGNLMTRQTGAVLNPNMQLLFKQPQLRPFQFTFQLTPRDEKESWEVMQIIRLFKQAMAPIRSDSMLFLKSPHTFKLTYLHKTKDHPYIGSIKECALMTCGIDYTPDQNYSTYDDGVMTSYTLALQFKELEPVYNDDYGFSNAKNLNFDGTEYVDVGNLTDQERDQRAGTIVKDETGVDSYVFDAKTQAALDALADK